MLFLDHTQVQYCKLKGKDKPVSGIIYNGNIFLKAKSFPKEELEIAIKECREEYLDHEERSKIATLLIKEPNSVGIWMHNKRYQQQDVIEIFGDKNSSNIDGNLGTDHAQTDLNRISIRQLASQMRSEGGVEIKTRRFKLKLYQRCFVGSEAVDWITKHAKVSRPDALKIGQKMLDKGIFHHVLDEHQFQDENLFYRFQDDEGKSIWNSIV
jgi:hypothetical protein